MLELERGQRGLGLLVEFFYRKNYLLILQIRVQIREIVTKRESKLVIKKMKFIIDIIFECKIEKITLFFSKDLREGRNFEEMVAKVSLLISSIECEINNITSTILNKY